MKRRRRKAQPTLTLLESAADLPEAPAPSVDTEREVFVIQNIALGNVTRLVLLSGDPRLPFQERAGVAVAEVQPGHMTGEETAALIDDLIAVLRKHGRTAWEGEQRVRAAMQRSRFELER
ncbi:MAG: hypothetical protein IPF87_04790 [Gemmatimonadetes bacterium]|nr:hypothetical protein [Gemmatimonadota bacterium]MBK7835254.1 hypothetical protein [Gemmatimonadota bacterium]MBK9406597.1 hypothetical protein [Gemmatimonadota bacterium]